jgi:hypothetical protein
MNQGGIMKLMMSDLVGARFRSSNIFEETKDTSSNGAKHYHESVCLNKKIKSGDGEKERSKNNCDNMKYFLRPSFGAIKLSIASECGAEIGSFLLD